MKILNLFIAVLLLLTIAGCSNSLEEKGTPEYIAEINNWHAKRIENLKKENGWLNLVGLYWLEQGENSFGSAAGNKIQFPQNAPANIGKFILSDSTVVVEIEPGVEVYTDTQKVSRMELKHDLPGKPTILKYGSLRWFVIKRGDRYGIRLRDLESPLVKNFKGIERYPVNSDWKIEAAFEEYNPPKIISVPNILGTIDEEKSPGALTFIKEGQKYRLDVMDGDNSYFIVFADLTSGKETYGGGRFLYVDKPDSTGKIFIDFNKAYNPPCVFTKYATCPLPPKQNHIKLEIRAGEKNYGEGH